MWSGQDDVRIPGKEKPMRKFWWIAILSSLVACGDGGGLEEVSESPEAPQSEILRAGMSEWFQDAKFGMFIHWGVYSVLGAGEWVMHQKQMTVSEYEKLPPQFNPTDYDPKQWVALAKSAGMKYITITSKHHDGFAMWDSQASDYDIVERTPFGKDVLKMLADECEREGIRLFFYHSHLDWHHPDYYPRGRTGQHSGRPEEGDFNRYLDYMDSQIAELASGQYAQLGGFWFDGWWDQRNQEEGQPPKATYVDWRLEKTYNLIHKLQPQALIGNNHHVAPFPGEDFQMFEKDLPGHNTTGFSADATIGQLPLETCETINKSWGFNKTDHSFKSTEQLIHYLVRAAGYNSNFLLNVGPTPQGTIQEGFVTRLEEIGEWLARYGESIYGTRGGPLDPQEWGVSTQKERRIYLHILSEDAPEEMAIPGSNSWAVKRVFLFESGKEISFKKEGVEQDMVISLPKTDRSPVDTIVVLER
jgi:alpha-L-fucosidase